MNQIVQQAPAHLQGNRRQVAAAAVQGMGTLPQPYISIEGGTFTLVDAQGNKMPWQRLGLIPHVTPQGQQVQALCLDAVVIDVNEHMSKAYYVDAWSPNAQQYLPPLCWSDNGLTPSINVTQAQNPTCEHCPHNKWGSKINNNGNEVKACDDLKKIAWYVPELQMNLVFLMRLKGSSHKNWRAYVEKVKRHDVMGRPADPVDVVTRIYFEPGATGILNFDMVGFIDAQTAAIEDQIWAAKSTDALIGRNDVPRALPAPQQPAALIQGQTYLPQPPQTAPQPMAQQPVYAPPQPMQPVHQPQPQTAPTAAPAGFGGAAPLPAGQPAPNAGFGGHAAAPNPAGNAATASPSNGGSLPPSGRPARGPRAPRAPRAQAVNQQPVAQPPAQPGFGGQPQQQNFGGQPQHQTPTAPPPQPPNQPQAQTAPAPQNFGIAAGAPLNADLENALNSAIGT